MTHNEIYTKFMIEYDKANVTSSYPSLTPIEIATILNKAYLALIAQKVTGNNPRQAAFESDSKAISDVQPLLITEPLTMGDTHSTASNSKCFYLPNKFLYYISGSIDRRYSGKHNVILVSHEVAQRFKETAVNKPWIKNSVAYIEGKQIVVLYDIHNNMNQTHAGDEPTAFNLSYVKQPSQFTKDSMREDANVDVEVNDSMVEELISLAVTMALENVESTRLQTKAQMRGLEA